MPCGRSSGADAAAPGSSLDAGADFIAVGVDVGADRQAIDHGIFVPEIDATLEIDAASRIFGRQTEGTTVARVRVLLVGLDPDIVDKPPVPELTPATVHAAVEAESAKLETLGYSVKSLLVDDGKTAEAVLTDALTSSGYDCIMMGAGLRVVPGYLLLFEKLINVVHRQAPASTKLCFSSNPSDTAEAVRRWV